MKTGNKMNIFGQIKHLTQQYLGWRRGEALIRKGRFHPAAKFKRNENDNTLIVEHLNVYIKNNHILKDVNLSIPDKKITCIIGPSGCGKSTLLKTLNRLVDNIEGVKTSGKVLINGKDILNEEADLTELRRCLGLVSQKPCPLPMNIYANVAYGCRIHGIRMLRKLNLVVEHYLQAVGLWEEVKDRLRTPAVRLSIGQQQRLCLARSLAVEPHFILADEATSALDPISSNNIEELFVSLKKNYSIIMVTHTLQQALRIADYVVFMYMGEIIEQGDAQQIFNNPQHEMTKKYLEGVFS